MTTPMANMQKPGIEALIDAHGLANLLGCIHSVVEEKAQHIQENWQDRQLASLWQNAAKVVDTAAAKVERIGL